MEEAAHLIRVLRFGNFEVDLKAEELRKSGVKIKLPGQPFQVLRILLEHRGDVVTREELQKRLWPDSFVDFDHNLNTAINKIREALADSSENPRFVETLSRRGYRFICPITVNGTQKIAPAPLMLDRSRIWIGIGIVSLLVLALAVVWLGFPTTTPRVASSTRLTHDGRPKNMGGTIVTDGVRLYFSEFEADHGVLAQVSAGGGEVVFIPTPFQNAWVEDISPDHMELLVSDANSLGEAGKLWAVPTLGGSPRRLGNIVGGSAAWSPDGKMIVYATTPENALFIANGDGTGSRKLVKLPGFCSWIRWAPDGSRLRFTIDGSELWEVSADGSHLGALFPARSGSSTECCGNWTVDGKYYVFQSDRGNVPNIWVLLETGGPFARTRPDPVQLTSGASGTGLPVPSRDGKKLFVVAGEARGELVAYDRKSGQWAPYLSGVSAEGVTFSRDRQWAAYVTFEEGNLWRSKLDGSQRMQLTSPPFRSYQPWWSPDGKRIAFMGNSTDGYWHIYVVSPDGGSPEQLTVGSGGQSDPSWSPDGDSLAFTENVGNPNEYSIRVLNLKTRGIVEVTGSERICCPRWSPDGRYIAAIEAIRGHNQGLTLFDFAAQKWQVLNTDIINFMTWSRDGKTLYFDTILQSEPAFYSVRMNDLRSERVLSLKTLRRAPGLFGPWSGLTTDDSPLTVRDVGAQDVYALEWQAR